MMSGLWVAVETSMRAIRSGGGAAKGGKGRGVFKKPYFGWKWKLGNFGGEYKTIQRSHQKRSRSGVNIRGRKFSWSVEYSKKCKDGGKVALTGNGTNERFCAIGRQKELSILLRGKQVSFEISSEV